VPTHCRVYAGAQHAGHPARLLVSHHPGGIDALAGVDFNGLQQEFKQNPNALRAELLQEPIKAEDGFVKLPERPGLGVELDPAVIERYRVR